MNPFSGEIVRLLPFFLTPYFQGGFLFCTSVKHIFLYEREATAVRTILDSGSNLRTYSKGFLCYFLSAIFLTQSKKYH